MDKNFRNDCNARIDIFVVRLIHLTSELSFYLVTHCQNNLKWLEGIDLFFFSPVSTVNVSSQWSIPF